MAKTSKSGAGRKRNGAAPQNKGSHRLFDDILALAATLARGRQEFGAERLMTLAASTRDFAASLSDMPNLRAQAASAAESLDGLAEYVMHTDIEQMVKDAGAFARRHPLATLAITAAAGLAASRMMRPVASRTARNAVPKRKRAAPRTKPTAAQSRRRANGQAHASA